MKKLLTLLLLSPLAFAEINLPDKLEVNLICKVSDQVLLGIKDGKSSRYSNFIDDVKTGDSLNIKFSMKHTENFYNLSINSQGLHILGTQFKSDEIRRYPYRYEYFANESLKGHMTPNEIFINNLFSKTSIERYFKNDWQLISTTKLDAESTRLLTANCMNMPSQFNDMLEVIEEVSGKLDN